MNLIASLQIYRYFSKNDDCNTRCSSPCVDQSKILIAYIYKSNIDSYIHFFHFIPENWAISANVADCYKTEADELRGKFCIFHFS